MDNSKEAIRIASEQTGAPCNSQLHMACELAALAMAELKDKELEAIKKQPDYWDNVIAAKDKEIEGLEELCKFAQHTRNCDASITGKMGICTCGFSKALKEGD